MKLAFSTALVPSRSFLELCEVTARYGFSGFEISSVEQEMTAHFDSIFKSELTVDQKRKLINRKIQIATIVCPEPITATSGIEKLNEYINYCVLASVKSVVIKIDGFASVEELRSTLMSAVTLAEENGVDLLIETVGEYASTEKVLEVLNALASASVKVCWNIRETFFRGKETADQTIQTLGAYIGYVKIGDEKEGAPVLMGDGELPVKEFLSALRSLNYDGYICVIDGGKITSPDIILTHFEVL